MNVLVIGDTHCPCMLPEYVPFLKKMQRKYKCTEVVHIGDLVDWAAISYHPKAPSLKNPVAEFERAYEQVQQIRKAFPHLTWLIGNHCSLTERQASDVGLPLFVLKDYADLWNVPNWDVVPRFGQHVIDGVIYQHGDRGKSNQTCAAYANAMEEHKSVVQGHWHGHSSVVYFANQTTRIFGCQVGCGLDHKLAAMAYGKKFNRKPIVSCGIIIDGHTAIVEPMFL